MEKRRELLADALAGVRKAGVIQAGVHGQNRGGDPGLAPGVQQGLGGLQVGQAGHFHGAFMLCKAPGEALDNQF